ncbi:MAG TPA: MFS transporter, partial [Pseudolabrys sp.]
MNAFGQSLALLRTRRFGTFAIASLLSNIGTWAQQVAEPWLLLSLGASSLIIGLDSFVLAAPAWILTLAGGELADRTNRRQVIVFFQSIQMLCPITLVVLLLTATVQPWMIIVLSLIVGITDALSMPSFQSIVPSIVSRDQVASALA